MTKSQNDFESRRKVAAWLYACCVLLFIMVVVGGVTRLTHSGLSIVEWQPIVGTLPPMSQEAWSEVFAKYQRTPEYRLVNHQMTLEEFKGIFWWEYGHRLLGRLIGLAFLLPLIYFVLRGMVDRPLAYRLGAIFLLGGLQGAMGWYMVKSGLVDDPRVSQFRLTAHLGIALVIYAAMLWVALGLTQPRRGAGELAADHRSLWRFSVGLTAVVFGMSLLGGLVAGTRAGLAYNTFPLMNGHWIPPDILTLDPWHANLFHNLATVQFNHRLVAWLLLVVTLFFWWRSRRADLGPHARFWCNALLAMLAIQFTLGVMTLLWVVPVGLGAAHQGGAVLLLTAAIMVNHQLLRERQPNAVS